MVDLVNQTEQNLRQISRSDNTNTAFDCNICMEQAKDPVVTVCGHLYCWPCLYRWLQIQTSCNSCPVCKAGIDAEKVIPIYGKGSEQQDPRRQPVAALKEESIPQRPIGQRPVPFQRIMHNDGSIGTQPAFGLVPSLLGYHHPPGAAHREPLTPEQQHQAFLSRVLLLLGSFVIMCLLLF